MNLFFLSKENVQLAQGEIESLLGKGKLIDNLLLLNRNKTTKRLAYTRFVLNVVVECNKNEIMDKIKKIDWNKTIKGSFALFFLENNTVSQTLSREYGGIIYDLLKNPKVDLEKPKTKLIMLEKNNRIYLGIEIWTNKESFYERRPIERPGHQPITIMPKFARACVNLTGSKTKVYDPFCGVGGFLIEAGLMKLKAIGSDISNKMIYLCKKNLTYYKIKKFKVFKEDALKITKKYDYIVTDPPYGKAAKVVGANLYENFLKELKMILKKRAVVIFPNFIDAENLIKKAKLEIKANYSVYIHKNLTRNIYVLEP